MYIFIERSIKFDGGGGDFIPIFSIPMASEDILNGISDTKVVDLDGFD